MAYVRATFSMECLNAGVLFTARFWLSHHKMNGLYSFLTPPEIRPLYGSGAGSGRFRAVR